MAQDSSFAELMARLRAGDGDAASRVFQLYAQRLIALARSRLDGRLRQKVDPEDVMQSVFRSFFRRQGHGDFEVAGWDSLWGLLAVITLHKCGHQVEYFQAARRDVRREEPGRGVDDSRPGWDALARDPTPAEAAVLAETVERVMRGLEDHQRQIFELTLQGNEKPEIARQVGCTQRTVRRVLGNIRKRLERLGEA